MATSDRTTTDGCPIFATVLSSLRHFRGSENPSRLPNHSVDFLHCAEAQGSHRYVHLDVHYKRNGLLQYQLANALCRCIANQLHRLHHHRLRCSLVLLAGAKLGTMVSHARVPAVLLEPQVPLSSTSASPSNRTRDDHVRGYSGSLPPLVFEHPNRQGVVPTQPRGKSANDNSGMKPALEKNLCSEPSKTKAKSHVKSQNHLTLSIQTTSPMKFSYPESSILKTVEKNK